MDPIAVEEIIDEQQKHQHPVGVEKDDNGVYKKGQQTWIPDKAKMFRLRIAVNSHCGDDGHRACDATLEIITKSYWWTHVK